MIAEEYLSRSRVFRRLKNGFHGQLIERYAARLAEEGLAQEGGLRCLSLVGDFMEWIASSGSKVADIDERMVERYLRYRGGKQSIQPGDRAALKRWLSVLRETGTITPARCSRLPRRTRYSRSSAIICEGNEVCHRGLSSAIYRRSAGF